MKNNTTLVNSLLSAYEIKEHYKSIALVLFGTLLLAASSKVQVPFWPVPMTMQTFVVFVIGMSYGWKLGFFTLIVYLFEGEYDIDFLLLSLNKHIYPSIYFYFLLVY